jgi:hypothetical protein
MWGVAAGLEKCNEDTIIVNTICLGETTSTLKT